MDQSNRLRVAHCGHEYEVPVTFHQGRRRMYGECSCKRDETYNNRRVAALRASMTRWNAGEMVRSAKCGHKTAYHPGPAKHLCDACRDVPRNCTVCGTDIRHRKADAKFCGQACRSIRSGTMLIGPRDQKVCALSECDVVFVPYRSGVRCCSEKHGQVLWNRETRADGRQPSPWNDRRRNNHHGRRARLAKAESEDFTVAEIIARDGRNCGICSEPIDPELKYPDPFSQSLDHIVPIARGGGHTLANCQLAHLRCNLSKGARVA